MEKSDGPDDFRDLYSKPILKYIVKDSPANKMPTYVDINRNVKNIIYMSSAEKDSFFDGVVEVIRKFIIVKHYNKDPFSDETRDTEPTFSRDQNCMWTFLKRQENIPQSLSTLKNQMGLFGKFTNYYLLWRTQNPT